MLISILLILSSIEFIYNLACFIARFCAVLRSTTNGGARVLIYSNWPTLVFP